MFYIKIEIAEIQVQINCSKFSREISFSLNQRLLNMNNKKAI